VNVDQTLITVNESVEACCTPIRRDALTDDDAVELADAFKALSDPIRLRLLNLIATGDLTEAVDRSQPTVSHHLKVLRDAGLVTASKRGTWAWYSVNARRLDDLRRVLARR
jgi:ArsR family transcriptional regulator, arsenate/arsenite/antimonite-responsive transcriptional repressor